MKVFKNKKQRFVAVFLSLVFAFMLVPFTDAYAGTVELISADTGGNISFKNNSSPVYMFHIIDSNGTEIWRMASLTRFTVTSYLGTTWDVTDTINCDDIHGNFHPNAFYYQDSIGECFGETVCPYYTIRVGNNDISYNTLIYEFLENGRDTNFECSVTDSEGGYSNEIGALKNVARNTLYPDHANNVDSVFWRFRYASKTTKGYNVKTSGTKIRVYESVTYYKRSDDSVYSESPKVLVGEYDATSLQFDMDVNEAFNKTTSETDSQYIANAWTIMTKQIVRNDRIYLQVVNAKGNCGDYLRIGGHADNASNATDNPQTVVDEDGNEVSEENGGYSTDDTDGDVGTSIDGDLDTADDDANSKPEEKENIGDSLDHAISTIRSLIDMIRHIPEIISILFSFLPPWCLSVVALGFVALVVLIAYKLIRG